MRELGGVTSTWANLPRVTRRCAQAVSMPLAWAATLGICAASAFAVRDTVFPTLGESASPSVWEPAPAATAPRFSAVDALDVTTPVEELPDTVRPTVLEVDLGQSSSIPTLPEAPAASELRAQAGPPFRGSTSGSSGSTEKPPTVTTVHHAPSTSSPSPSTSAPTVTTSASSPSTTDPATTDSIGSGQSGRGSGSGGGGSDDDHP